MAADLSRQTSAPILSELPTPILREKPVRARSGRTKTLGNFAETPIKTAKPPLPQPVALRLEPRAGMIAAGARHVDSNALAALDRAAQCLSTQVFAVHETPVHAGNFEQIHNLPAMTPDKGHDLFRRASAYVALGQDPLGPFLIEAAQHGCPLVLPDTTELRAVWDGAALFLRLKDRHHLCGALRRLLEDPEHCQRLALAALRRSQTLARPKPLTPLHRSL
jgi:hypothetical protein